MPSVSFTGGYTLRSPPSTPTGVTVVDIIPVPCTWYLHRPPCYRTCSVIETTAPSWMRLHRGRQTACSLVLDKYARNARDLTVTVMITTTTTTASTSTTSRDWRVREPCGQPYGQPCWMLANLVEPASKKMGCDHDQDVSLDIVETEQRTFIPCQIK
jgi:hypothetical protein